MCAVLVGAIEQPRLAHKSATTLLVIGVEVPLAEFAVTISFFYALKLQSKAVNMEWSSHNNNLEAKMLLIVWSQVHDRQTKGSLWAKRYIYRQETKNSKKKANDLQLQIAATLLLDSLTTVSPDLTPTQHPRLHDY